MTPYYETKLGKLYHGDCLEIMPELEPVDLVLTDPPYGLGGKLNGGTWGNEFGKGLSWDTTKDEAIAEILSGRGDLIIWGGNYYNLPPSRCWLVWFKPDSVATMADVELAWTNMDKNSRMIKHSIAATNKERVDHPTQKPIAVMQFSALQSVGKVVLDPFLGSGTTAIACERLNRRWIGIEISEKYCEIAAKRIESEASQLKLWG